MGSLLVEVENSLVEVDNLLVHLGFLLVAVGSGLVADDYQVVLGGLSIVVVFPPCLLCDERFFFLLCKFLLPEDYFPNS